MKVFISWSGDDSRKIAAELYEWLPMVVQSIQPYMSAESIDKGTRWASSISSELEGTHVGIVVLTPSNISAPWINFEAGALAKIVDDTRLAPVLFGLKPSDVGTPLSQFQVTLFNKEDILKLLKSINSSGAEEALPEARLEKMHSALWDELVAKIEPVVSGFSRDVTGPKKPENETSQVLEELLVLARQQAVSIHNPEKILSPTVVRMIAETVLDQNFPSSDRHHLGAMTRALFSRWKDFLDVCQLEAGSEDSESKRSDRLRLAHDFEAVLRDLLDFSDVRHRRPGARYRVRDAEFDRPRFKVTQERMGGSSAKVDDPDAA